MCAQYCSRTYDGQLKLLPRIENAVDSYYGQGDVRILKGLGIEFRSTVGDTVKDDPAED